MNHKHLSPAVYTPMPRYMADPRMAWARFIDGDGAGGTTPPAPSPAPAPVVPADPKPATGELGEGGVKALQAERDARKAAEKTLAEREARIKELEDATKSDEDKRAERLAALEKAERDSAVALTEREAKLLRYEIAAEKGLDLRAAARLVGSTREEIEKDADEFKAAFATAGGIIPGAGTRGTASEPEPDPGLGRLRAAYEASAKK